jgi:hypothetical protein
MRRPVSSAGCVKLPMKDALEGAKRRPAMKRIPATNRERAKAIARGRTKRRSPFISASIWVTSMVRCV